MLPSVERLQELGIVRPYDMPVTELFDLYPGGCPRGNVVYPATSPCPAGLAIHLRLLDLRESTVDLRYLHWLEAVSQAKQLLAELRNTIPQQWLLAAIIDRKGAAHRLP